MSAPGPALTELPGWEEVQTDPSQTVTSQAVRAVGRWGSLIGSGYREEIPSEVSREDRSLVRRLSKGKRLRVLQASSTCERAHRQQVGIRGEVKSSKHG